MYFINFFIDDRGHTLAQSDTRAVQWNWSTDARRYMKARYRIQVAFLFFFLLTIVRRKEGVCITYGYMHTIALNGFHDTDYTGGRQSL